MVCELTQGYGLLAAAHALLALCLILGRSTSLYEHRVESKFDSPAHLATPPSHPGRTPVKDFYSPGLVTALEEGPPSRR
jgi:CIC family chloride channel protein